MAASVMTMRWSVAAALFSLSFALCAESLQDPTKPLFGTGEGELVSAGVTGGRPNSKGLLSVIMSTTRCAAIIDGKTFKLGEKYGNATLVEITPNGILLMGSSGVRSMGLFPGVGVKVITQNAVQKSVTCKLEHHNIEKKVTRQSGPKEKK
jgi:MSHA biogenesis protein MshK